MIRLKIILALSLIILQIFCIAQDSLKCYNIKHRFCIEAGLHYKFSTKNNYTPRDPIGNSNKNPVYVGYTTIPLISFNSGLMYDYKFWKYLNLKIGISYFITRIRSEYAVDSLTKYGPVINLYNGYTYTMPLQWTSTTYNIYFPFFIGGNYKNFSILIGGKIPIWEKWVVNRKYLDNSTSKIYSKNSDVFMEKIIPSIRIDYLFIIKNKIVSIFFSTDFIYQFLIFQTGINYNFYRLKK